MVSFQKTGWHGVVFSLTPQILKSDLITLDMAARVSGVMKLGSQDGAVLMLACPQGWNIIFSQCDVYWRCKCVIL